MKSAPGPLFWLLFALFVLSAFGLIKFSVYANTRMASADWRIPIRGLKRLADRKYPPTLDLSAKYPPNIEYKISLK